MKFSQTFEGRDPSEAFLRFLTLRHITRAERGGRRGKDRFHGKTSREDVSSERKKRLSPTHSLRVSHKYTLLLSKEKNNAFSRCVIEIKTMIFSLSLSLSF